MNIKIKGILSLAVLSGLLLASCDKEPYKVIEDQPADNDAFVRIVHAAPSFRAIFNNRDSFNVYTSVNKLTSPFLTYGSVFPGATTNNYVNVPATSGTNPLNTGTSFRFSVQGTNQADSVNLYTFYKNLIPGRRYSLIITDSILNANETKQMLIPDDYVQPTPGLFGIRFVHAVANDTAGRTVDVFSAKAKANIFTNVPILSATGFAYLPTNLTTDTLIIRRAGVTNWELARFPPLGQPAITPIVYLNQRVYTFIYRGDTKLTSGTKARGLMSYVNL
ncbi:MAG: hypothetical protein JWP69_1031 [Flaviaesturariibacter sp.]|nr:hypothetical protein [Flaviaesturariibacter sp.]